jgi:LysM repeat protein
MLWAMATGHPDSNEEQTGTAADRAATICPYLLSADGAWRDRASNRGHRCQAVDPPARPSTRKQESLCLTPAYASCQTFLAAREAVAYLAARPAAGPPAVMGRYTVPRATPVVLDRGSRLTGLAELARSPRVGRIVLLALMLLTVVALVIARFGGGSGDQEPEGGSPSALAASASPVASPSLPTVAPSADPIPSPLPVISPSPSAIPSPSASPSASPSVSPSPASARTYTVKRGDTLSGIAARFDTTVAVLVKLNAIEDPSRIRVGQVLKLP